MSIDLAHIGRIIGSISFSSDARELSASHAVDGLVLHLPAEVTFNGRPPDPPGYLTDLRVTVHQNGVRLGSGIDSQFHWGYSDGPRKTKVSVPLTSRVLAAIERTCNGRAPAFRLHVLGKTGIIHMPDGKQILSAPSTALSANADVEFGRDRWIELLRSTGWGDSVVTEVAIPHSAEPPWDELLNTLKLARDALDRGGQAGWKACVSECRNVLEQWVKIEPLDVALQNAPRDLTRTQRFDVLRQSLHRYTHDSVHSPSDLTSRAEAVMVLGTLAGLLGIRLGVGLNT